MKADYKDGCFYLSSEGANCVLRVEANEFMEFMELMFVHQDVIGIKRRLRSIGLALNISHNTVTTDVPELCVEDEEHWRIDHSKEITQLEELERILFIGKSSAL